VTRRQRQWVSQGCEGHRVRGHGAGHQCCEGQGQGPLGREAVCCQGAGRGPLGTEHHAGHQCCSGVHRVRAPWSGPPGQGPLVRAPWSALATRLRTDRGREGSVGF
jgi:hypothetical protein